VIEAADKPFAVVGKADYRVSDRYARRAIRGCAAVSLLSEARI